MDRPDQARATAARADIAAIVGAPQALQARQRHLPEHRPGLAALVKKTRARRHSAQLEGRRLLDKCPWIPGAPSTVSQSRDRGEVDVYSLGADRKPAARASTPTSDRGSDDASAPPGRFTLIEILVVVVFIV